MGRIISNTPYVDTNFIAYIQWLSVHWNAYTDTNYIGFNYPSRSYCSYFSNREKVSEFSFKVENLCVVSIAICTRTNFAFIAGSRVKCISIGSIVCSLSLALPSPSVIVTMFNKLSSLFKSMGERNQKSFFDKIDAFNDPLAKEIEWSSISRIHCGFLNRKLMKTKNGSIFLIPSVRAIHFHLGFIIMGGYVMWEFSLLRPTIDTIVFHPISTFMNYIHFLPNLLSSSKVWGHLFGFVFLSMGLLGLCYSFRPIVFNTTNRLYSKGFLRKEKVSFDNIHALQIITTTGGEPEDPIVYELNLVLKNKERIHVFGHPKKKALIKDAADLSQVLSVPVWNMV